jgi:hypothetical protein
MFGTTPDPRGAGSLRPQGHALPADGGYRVQPARRDLALLNSGRPLRQGRFQSILR